MKKIDVVLGLQWGDEGKGKVVDVLTPDYKVIARFQGGPNAGHSLKFDGEQFVLHTVPSGIFRPDTINIIGNGVVIDPVILMEEIKDIEAKGGDISGKLLISKRAHLILPTHRILDAASEAAKGKSKIGSTLKGIGPTYMDKTGRNGLRVGDILSPEFKKKYETLKNKHVGMLAQYDYTYDVSEYEKKWFESVEQLKRFEFIESELKTNEYIKNDVPVLAEGAQGSMLDIDFGTYPFVTSSNTMSAGVCTGLGVAPCHVGKVIGIFKAYCTRVGSGPFPTELLDETGEELRRIGNEFGATTGRPRRMGWFDCVASKYGCRMQGTTDVAFTVLDVLGYLDEIPVCVGYEIDGAVTTDFPTTHRLDRARPVLQTLPGWKSDIRGITKYEDLPENCRKYVEFIEAQIGYPITMVSNGPGRNDIIYRNV